MAIKISGSTIIDDSRNIVAGVAATFTGNVIVGSGVTINSTGVIATGIATAASFDGSLATTNLTGTVTNAQLAGSIADSKLNTISTAGKVDLAALEIDGGTDIGAALADADLFIVDDAAGGTNRKTAASRIKTYIADVTLTTAAQTNITSLGTLSAVTVSGDITANGNITGDGVTIISGISTVGATTFYGKLNNLTFPSANGSDGQVLTSDGAGVAQWEDASGGSVTSDSQRNTLGGTNAGDSFSGTSATDNTLFGYDAGTAFTGGDKNTAFGSYALRTQTTANGSVAIGYSAGTIVDNDGHSSTYIGYRSGSRITDGSSNTAVGYDALRTDGALYGGGSGSYLNVAIGHNAMSACGISRQNVAVGCDTLRVNAAWSNTAVGNGAGYSNTSGTRNLFAGRLSGNLNTTGSYQTILGFEAGADITEGSYNTIVGGFSGHTGTNNLTTGSNNTLIGYGVSASSATVSHEITLGNDNVTKFRIPGVNFSLKDTTATEDYVLTVDANGDCGWEAASGGGLSNFTESENTSSPNNTVSANRLIVTGSATNIDAVFQSKGTGAILAQLPDSGTGGGNKRGDYAVDWQMDRNNANQVASGEGSVIGGGKRNRVTGDYCTVAGGQNNYVTDGYSFVGGGYLNEANGQCSSVLGGSYNDADAYYSTVIGNRGKTRWRGHIVFGANASTAIGNKGGEQSGITHYKKQTTDATPTTMGTAGSSGDQYRSVAPPNNSAYGFTITVVGAVGSGGDCSMWKFEGLIKRGANAAATAIVGNVVKNRIAYDSGASAWDVNVTANTSQGSLVVTVTGEASTTIRWIANVETTEITYS